jgi:hypothetical protein
MNAPKVGDKFDITPDTDNEEMIIVTDVQVTAMGFIVEGLPVDRDPDDFSLLIREFVTDDTYGDAGMSKVYKN